MKLQTYESSIFIGQGYFINDELQNLLIFQPIFNTFTTQAVLTYTVIEHESKGLSNENIKPPITANQSLSTKITWVNNSKIIVRFTGSC